jgi:DNA-binding MarR family transcriptional regulator
MVIISKRQTHCLLAIYELHKQFGVYPSVRDVGKKIGLSSPQSVASLFVSLQNRGLLDKSKNRRSPVKLTMRGQELAKKILRESPKIRQISFYDIDKICNFDLKNGTQANLEAVIETTSVKNNARLLLDADSASNLNYENRLDFFDKYGSKVKVDINKSAAFEYSQKFNDLPKNVSVISEKTTPANTTRFFPGWESEIMFIWRSSSFGIWFDNNSTRQLAKIKVISFNNVSNQLTLPFGTGLCQQNLKKSFLRSLRLFAEFSPFRVFGAVYLKTDEMFICSAHTARKNADFANFTSAVEKGYYFVSGGDKSLMRDLQFNNIPVFVLRNINNQTRIGEK